MAVRYGNMYDGLTQSRPGASARAIKLAFPNSADGTYWIKPPGYSTAFQVYCDMTTRDEDGDTGWMLVASWASGYQWTYTSVSSSSTFSTTALNSVSSNFGNVNINCFRVTSSPAATTLGGRANADWYYYYSTPRTWKSVWAPDNTRTQYYLSAGTNPAVPRQSLKKFDKSYNLKYRYANNNHKYNNLSDFGYTNTPNGDGTANLGGSNAIATGYCRYWLALTTPGYNFGVFYNSYTGDFDLANAPVSDGSLAIPQQGAGTDSTGQDIDNNISAKIGIDDGGIWQAASDGASISVGNNGYAATAMWWWIK
jgi:hypothetical protein